MKNFKLIFGFFMLILSFFTFILLSNHVYENSKNVTNDILAMQIAFVFPILNISLFYHLLKFILCYYLVVRFLRRIHFEKI